MRTRALVAGVGLAVVALASSSRTVLSHDRGQGPESRVRKGLEISPVELKFHPRDRRWVGLGSYIVNAQGACNDCHTCPSYASGGFPYAGQKTKINSANYLAGGVPFGPFTSANITPDDSGKPHGLTFAEFKETLRTGHNPQDPPGEILQVMPWPIYGNMTDDDLRAVYAFLRAIPQATPGTCTGPSEPTP